MYIKQLVRKNFSMLRQPVHNKEEFDSFSYSKLAQERIIGCLLLFHLQIHTIKREQQLKEGVRGVEFITATIMCSNVACSLIIRYAN